MRLAFGVLLVVVTLAAASLAAAQEPEFTLPTPPSADYVIVTKQEYRKGVVRTHVNVERMPVDKTDTSGEPVELSASFSQGLARASIDFYSLAPKCKFPSRISEVIFVADGETIRLVDDVFAARRGEGSSIFSFNKLEGGKCDSKLYVAMPQRIYLKIANARSVEVRTGELKLRLGENSLKALRELARRMLPPGAQHNNGMHPTEKSAAFMRETWPFRG